MSIIDLGWLNHPHNMCGRFDHSHNMWGRFDYLLKQKMGGSTTPTICGGGMTTLYKLFRGG
jgi:hypothetical protein